MAGERGQVAEVAQQENDRVLISLPMVGFPQGFQLRRGERVVVVQDENGLAVRPLVRAIEVNDVNEDPTEAVLVADNARFAVQESTIRAKGPVTADEPGGPEPHAVFVVDRGSADGPEQVIAVRPQQ